MLSDLQKAFLRKYLNVGSALSEEHSEAKSLWNQIAEARNQAAVLLEVVADLKPPEQADASETAAIASLTGTAAAVLQANLTEDNALEAVARGRELIGQATDAIASAAERIEAAKRAWATAFAATGLLISTCGLNPAQKLALQGVFDAVGTPAADLGDTDAVIARLARVQELHDLISAAVTAGQKRLAACDTVPDALHEAETNAISTARAAAEMAIAALVDSQTADLTDTLLGKLEGALADGAAAANLRGSLRKTLESLHAALTAPDEASAAEASAITGAAEAARLALSGQPDAQALQMAIEAATLAAVDVEKAKSRIAAARLLWDKAVAEIDTKLAAGRTVPLSADQTKAVQAGITAARNLLTKDLTNVQAAVDALKVPDQLLTLLNKALDTQSAALAKVPALPADALTIESAKYDAAKDLATQAIAAFVEEKGINDAAAKIATLAGIAQSVAASVDKRKALFTSVGKAKLEAACAAFGSADVLDQIVGAVKPDCSGLFDDSKIAPKDLATLFNEALAGDATILAAVFQTGFAGEAAQLKTFASSLAADDRKRVTAMISNGGFAEAPQALGELVKVPGGTDKLKALGVAFNDPPALASLRRGVTQGGLGGAGARSPDVLASVLTDGVATAADLKAHLDGFGATGMDEMRAMLSAFDGKPPPSVAGKAFAKVAARVCPPPDGMKAQFFDTLDKGSAMSGAAKALEKVAADPTVSAAAKAIGRTADPVAESGLTATFAGVAALQAGAGVPGVDASQRALLEKAIVAAGKATIAMADAARLGADPAAAQAQAVSALDASDLTAATKANEAATAAGAVADLAKTALSTASPATADLLDKAAAAAKDAVDTAKLAPDDAVRFSVLAQAQDCFAAVKAATTALTGAVAADAQTKSQTAALTTSDTEGAKVSGAAIKRGVVEMYQEQVDDGPQRIVNATDKRDKAILKVTDTKAKQDIAIAKVADDLVKRDAALLAANKTTLAGQRNIARTQEAYDKAVLAEIKATEIYDKAVIARIAADADLVKENTTFADAGPKLAAAQLVYAPGVKADRKTALVEIQAAADRAEGARNAKLIADTPALQEAHAKAARLQALAATPKASSADHAAAAEAASEAARLMSDAVAATAVAAVTALDSPDLTPLPDGSTTVTAATPVSSAKDLIAAALDVKQALSLAIVRQAKAQDACLAQERLVLDAQAEDTKMASVAPFDKALADAKVKLAACDAERTLAATAASTLSSAARDAGDALTNTIGAHTKVLAVMDPADLARPGREAERAALQKAAAMLVLVLNRSYSVVFPGMSRHDLMSVASTMTKNPALSAMSAAEPLTPDATVDMKHFCGRHTREFSSFEGRDLSDYDEAMDAAILKTQRKGATVADLLPGERKIRDSRAVMKTTSMWPANFGEADMKACLILAIGEVEKLITADAASGAAGVCAYIALKDDQRAHKGTQFGGLTITHATVTYTVTIAFKIVDKANGKYEVSQFFPTSTPSVPFADMHSIKSAMKH